MTNLENLERYKFTPERAREVGKKGGEVRSVLKQFSRRKYCDYGCPLYLKCWAMPIAQANPEFKDGKKCLCALKTLPLRTQRRALRLLKGKRAGFINEIIEQLLLVANQIDESKDKKGRQEYISALLESMKAIYGVKQQVTGDIGITTKVFHIDSNPFPIGKVVEGKKDK